MATLFLAAALPCTAGGQAPAAAESLIILHTNDIHSHLFPFHRADTLQVGGAAARAARIQRERREAPDLLLLDAGDVIQGTPAYNLFRGVPDTRVLSLMRYDAVALGNHDLDDGPAAWIRLRKYANFPVVSANVFAAAESSWARTLTDSVPADLRAGARWIGGQSVPKAARLRFLATPYVILPWKGLKVGVLGLTTGNLVNIVRISSNRGVAVVDPITVARKLVPEIRAKADLVVALTHIGVEQDRVLAREVPGIDVIVGGHSHTRLHEVVYAGGGETAGKDSVPIVQTGSWGDKLGRSVLGVVNGRAVGFSYRLLTVLPAEGEDAEIRAMLAPVADSVAMAMGESLYYSEARFPQPRREDVETPIGNFAADVLREAGGADVGIVNTGGIRAPIPKGPVTVADIYSTFPFDNTIVVVPMRGEDLRRLLDFVASRAGKSDFAQVSGVTFDISGDYAADIRVGGQPLENGRIYRVATIDFLYEGGAGYSMFKSAGQVEPTGFFQHEAAVSFLRRHPAYRFGTEGRIVWEGSPSGGRSIQTR